MAEIEILAFGDRLRERFRDYLLTTNLLGEREVALRQTFEAELGRRDLFATGPYLSMLPAYETGVTARELLGREAAPRLHASLSRCAPGAFDVSRPLYTHQVDALRFVQEGSNVVVATGTGSGKTECFLLPVLDDAARQRTPGVRCIVIYPMNALANDQLSRLRTLLRDVPEISFGRYTGETPETREECSEDDRAAAPRNERLSRSEIQRDPPHVLLTNFAMLEYLLLRPKDFGIFSHRQVRFVVLDEAHSYTGAQGIDVSFLLRRVRQAYASPSLQFILTSATIAEGTGDEARRDIAAFASQLTGARFEPGAVIFGSRKAPFVGPPCGVSPDDLLRACSADGVGEAWRTALHDLTLTQRLVAESGIPLPAAGARSSTVAELLYHWMQSWPTVRSAHDALAAGPRQLDEVARVLFGHDRPDALQATEWLLLLSLHARRTATGYALLPTRFHFFFRGLNGASLCVNAAVHGPGGKLFLEDRNLCDQPCLCRVLPLTTCVQCGLAVHLVREQSGRWAPLSTDPIDTQTGIVWALAPSSSLPSVDPEDDDQEAGEGAELCLEADCRRVQVGSPLPPHCVSTRTATFRAFRSSDGRLSRCPRCGAQAGGTFDSVLRYFRTGDDAATAVLAEEILRGVPVTDNPQRPAGGRQLLAFSDSRQRAAFFAPYLARTTAETEYDPRILRAVRDEIGVNKGRAVDVGAALSRFRTLLDNKAYAFVPTFGEDEVVDFEYRRQPLKEKDRKAVQRFARIRLWDQLCRGQRQRRTWASMGLIWPSVELPRGMVERLAPKLSCSEEVAESLCQELLRFVLSRKAICFEQGPDAITARDLGPGPVAVTFHRAISGSQDGRHRHRWNPFTAGGQPKRSTLAQIVAVCWGVDVATEPSRERLAATLDAVWDALREYEVLLPLPGGGGEHQLDEGRVLISQPATWQLCAKCGRLTANRLTGVCCLSGCGGALSPISQDEIDRRFARNHYRRRLLLDEPMALVVKEHTAQLSNDAGRIYQKDFVEGRVNVLSTSTTFELGVDVGGLQAVLLRNVPPTSANYLQRAGRAGRRRDGVAVAVTFCRSLPHDQYHFHSPLSIVSGIVPVPRINLLNARLLQRHVNSTLLGMFLRTLPLDAPWRKVRDFFLVGSGEANLADRCVAGLSRDLAAGVSSLLFQEGLLSAGEALAEAGRSLTEVGQTLVFDIRDEYERQRSELERQVVERVGSPGQLGRAIEAITKLEESLLNSDLIGFLAEAHWLPSYAFPQDNVKLLVRQPGFAERMRLERDRELGISEYAPGAEVIADGRLFKSRGIVRRGKAFDIRRYRYCATCRQLRISKAGEAIDAFCSCGGGSSREFVEPSGFQTSVLDPVTAPNLLRARSASNSEIFLVKGAPPEAFRESERLGGVTVGYVREGQLLRANQGHLGRKYPICDRCGILREPGSRGPHDAPWGSRCAGGTVLRVDLAHIFETDTLQLRFDTGTWNPPPVNDRSFWLSFTTAFLNVASDVLNIPTRDLGASYRSQSEGVLDGELLVYDRVPGGAGYVERILGHLDQILRDIETRMTRCSNPLCEPSGSCYVCLRSYQNQFDWQHLSRAEVARFVADGLAQVGAPHCHS